MSSVPDLFDIPSVSDLTKRIKAVMEQSFEDILVEGEASNVKRSSNGHVYFTLKDSGAQLPCVMWRSTAQKYDLDLSDGQQIVVGGDIQVYAPHGRYQLIVGLVKLAGIGKLQQAFEELKAKLKAEGLFDQAHKQRLPRLPMKIGVVTSRTTAAFQDVRSTLESRWPVADISLYHAGVQGVQAASQIARGIRYFTTQKNIDVLIITRGGGSLEDLWPFNEEVVARALFECPVPVISAVGHETDYTISDFVADQRAATPTQAAVIATPDINEVRMFVEDRDQRVRRATTDRISRSKENVHHLAASHALQVVRQKIQQAAASNDALVQRLQHRQSTLLAGWRHKTEQLSQQLNAADPDRILKQGYSRIIQEKNWIRTQKDFDPESTFSIQWKDGSVSLPK